MRFFSTIMLLLLFWFLWTLSAAMHERDIQRACAENGRTGSVAWRGELKCSPIESPDDYDDGKG